MKNALRICGGGRKETTNKQTNKTQTRTTTNKQTNKNKTKQQQQEACNPRTRYNVKMISVSVSTFSSPPTKQVAVTTKLSYYHTEPTCHKHSENTVHQADSSSMCQMIGTHLPTQTIRPFGVMVDCKVASFVQPPRARLNLIFFNRLSLNLSLSSNHYFCPHASKKREAN